MNRLKEIDEHVLKCARTLYEETRVPMADIAKMMGISDRTLQARAALLSWLPRPNSRARRRLGIGPEADTADPAILAKTVRSRLEREIMDAERNLTKTGPSASRISDAERSARILASLTKTLNELKRLEAAGTDTAPKADDDDFDPDNFKRAIARRLDELVADEESGNSAGPADGCGSP